MSQAWPSLVALALIVVMLPAAAWLLRRTARPGASGGAALGVAAAVAVGARERIVLLRADRKWLVVGITAHSITALAELDEAPEGVDPVAPGIGPGRFADVLRGISRHAARQA